MTSRLTHVTCRAQVSENCLHGKPDSSEGGWWEDGTYAETPDHPEGSIVCDPCYIVLMPLTPSGKGLTDELPEAIEEARRRAS